MSLKIKISRDIWIDGKREKQLAVEIGKKKSLKINQKLSPCQHCVMNFFLINYFRSRRYLIFSLWPLIAQYYFVDCSVSHSRLDVCLLFVLLDWRSQWFVTLFCFRCSSERNCEDFAQRPQQIFMTASIEWERLSTLTLFALAVKYVQFASSVIARAYEVWAERKNCKIKDPKPKLHEKSAINVKWIWKVKSSIREMTRISKKRENLCNKKQCPKCYRFGLQFQFQATSQLMQKTAISWIDFIVSDHSQNSEPIHVALVDGD